MNESLERKMFELFLENKERFMSSFEHLFYGDHVSEIFNQNILLELPQEEADELSSTDNYDDFINKLIPQLLMDSLIEFSKKALENPNYLDEQLQNLDK